MERVLYQEEYKKWWDNLPEGEFTLILDKDYPNSDDFCWGWSSEMTSIIKQKKSKVITNKHLIEGFSSSLWEFDNKYTYPFQCYTVIKPNSLKYSYNI